MTEFGEKLGLYRRRLGLTQRALAEQVGLDSTQLNKVERGHRPPPSAKYVGAMVRSLHLGSEEAEAFLELAGLSTEVLKLGHQARLTQVPEPVEDTLRRASRGFTHGSGISLASGSRRDTLDELIARAEEAERLLGEMRGMIEELVEREVREGR